MSDISNKDVKFSFKVVINKQKTKVLFAEIDNDFADVLFSFLTLPLGTIVRLLKKHYGDMAHVFGSITTLCDGLSNLDSCHFSTEGCQYMLLNPISSFIDECRKLKLDIADNQPIKYFSCENLNCVYTRSNNLAMYCDTVKCNCGKQLKKEIPVRKESQSVAGGGVFTVSSSIFIISDDLQILPNSTSSVRKIVNNVGLIDVDGAESRNVTFGFNEIMDLLMGSLFSPTPLTNLILKKQMEYEPGTLFHQMEKRATANSVKFKLKVIFQKPSNRFLFAEAEEDFVEFLFSLLTISLGGVEYLLSNNTSLRNIDNLYRSIASPIDVKYLRTVEKTRLINPTIPCGYLSTKRTFSLTEDGAPKLYYNRARSSNEEYLTPSFTGCSGIIANFKPSRGRGNFVKGPRKYVVRDDLTVTPFCMTVYLTTLAEQKIPLSDVDELVLNIGLEEALSILKASLSSSSALSTGLNHLLKYQPKQEE